MNSKIQGIFPALVTPLNEKEEVNVPVLHRLTEHLAEEGADGFYIGGATGEGIFLNREQREILAEEGVKAAGKLPAVVHIASIHFEESLALARQAEAVGAAAVSAIPPMFYGYSKDDVFAYYKELADAVSIPLMVYYNPAAGFKMDADFAARLFQIDNVTSIKWTNFDFYEVIRLKNLTHGEMSVINGSDERLVAGLAAGADGGIGTTYNFMLPRFLKLYRRFMAKDTDGALQEQMQITEIINALITAYPVVPATKAILEKQGFDVGNCCKPLHVMTDGEKASLLAAMRAAGLTI